jgi:hypothetical protein
MLQSYGRQQDLLVRSEARHLIFELISLAAYLLGEKLAARMEGMKYLQQQY